MVTLSTCGEGVSTGGGVMMGCVSAGGVMLGMTGVLTAPGAVEPLRLMLTSTTTARMTASRSMPPKISCQRELLAARSPAGVAGSAPALVAGTRSLCLTRRVPQ